MKRFELIVLVWCLTACAEVKNAAKDGVQAPETVVPEQSGKDAGKVKPEKVQN